MRNPIAAKSPDHASTDGGGLPQTELVAAIPRLRRYARALIRNPSHADDLLQDTLLRAWDKRTLWRQGSDLRAWLFTIMHNVFANQHARRRREATNLSVDSEDGYALDLQAAQSADQLKCIELREVLQQVDRLPVEQREALLLAAEGLRYDEIATVLAIPIGTVMSRLSRARDRLRRMAMESRCRLP